MKEDEKKESVKTNILTFSGIEMNPLDPAAEDIEIKDIAHALSMLARANGHFKSFHSVAQHSMECALEAEARGYKVDLILFCLLHDAAEAYLGDFVSPVKHQMEDYNLAEDRLLSTIYEKYVGRCPDTKEKEIVKEIDHTMLYHEFMALMGRPVGKRPEHEILTSPDYPEKNWRDVEEDFLELYDLLKRRQRLSGIKGVMFDVDDTLYSQQESFGDACRRVWGDCHGIPVRDLFFAYYDTYNQRIGPGEEQEKSFGLSPELLQQERIIAAYEKFSVSIPRREAELFQEIYLDNQKNRELSSILFRMFEECAGRFELGIISNGNESYQNKKIDSLGLRRWFDAERILISEAVGFDKPDLRIFRTASDRMGLAPSELLYVGDSLNNDIYGAKKAGWMTVWINRNRKETGDEDPVPDYELHTEEEMAALISSVGWD